MSMQQTRKGERGQAVVMVTLALVAMCGLMGLAVDMGWMFFVKKQAQAAADAAAMAAVQEALFKMGGTTTGFVCGSISNIDCAATPEDCSSVNGSGNLNNGCQYAARNGFSSSNSRQKVTIQAYDNTMPPPTVSGVNELVYWVTVRTVQTVPQLFSAVLGNTQGTVSARATAGIVRQILPGSLYAMNREVDCTLVQNKTTCGVDIDLSGAASGTCTLNGNSYSSTICAPGGAVLASACNGNNNPPGCSGMAGQSNGSANLAAPSIQTRGTANPNWLPSAPADGMNDSSMFRDPTTGLPQPPLMANSPVQTCGILNGDLIGTNGTVGAGPYNYYSYHLDNQGHVIPDSQPITLVSNVTFSASYGCPGILSSGGQAQTGSSFPTYFFYGGLNVGSSAATFGPGQYVEVGTLASGNSGGAIFNVSSQGSIQSSGSGASYPGNMFILTAPGYPGLSTQINAFPELTAAAGPLAQGTVNIQGGASTGASLNGIQKGDAPSALDSYSGILFWQDRRNSTVEYNPDGTIANAPATAAQMSANLASASSPGWTLQAAPKGLGFNGVIYQPRGAWLTFQGNGNDNGSYQVITGAIIMGGGPSVTLTAPTVPFLKLVCTLIE
jgi:Flp pilus assembly protein TadG